MRPDRLTSPETRVHQLPRPFELESGATLVDVRVAYRTWGRPTPDADNVILVCHALTGSADVDAWWPDLLGPGRALDPDRDLVVCANVLGSCYGTTGPTSVPPGASEPWGPDFPAVTVRDMVRLEARLLDALGVRRLRLVVGGSLGGMQALEWAVTFPKRVGAVAAIATSARHSPWCIGLSEAQRAAIRADHRWRDGRYPPSDPPRAGLAAARMMAMCTYRSPVSFGRRFGRTADEHGFAAESYLRHHGDTLVERFDANSYLALTRAMDTHDLARGRGSLPTVLGRLDMPALVVGIPSDVLYLPAEQREIARLIPGARLEWLSSPHGHDGFLIETEALDRLLADFRRQLDRPRPAVAC